MSFFRAPASRGRTAFFFRSRIAALGLLALAPSLMADTVESAPAGVVEAGATDFIVLGPENIGLSTPPTDLHELPNGAMLVVAQDELALGDGVRWQTFRREASAPPLQLNQVAVGDDGSIYAGIRDGFARIELTNEGRWRPVPVATFPAASGLQGRLLSRVTSLADNWYWHEVSGALVAWRPGREPRVLGSVNGIESVFTAAGDTYVSDASSATAYRISDSGFAQVDLISAHETLRELVTAAVRTENGTTLLGTNVRGVQVFDGRQARPLATSGMLGGRYRINALCQVTAGWHAAAIDSVGVVFFTTDGQLRLVMDRTLDHRLARVQRLFAGRGGAVWALLSNGIARIAFPTRVTNFETKVSSGLAFSLLTRHRGELWLVTDGVTQHAVYEDGRLLRFDPETPPAYAVSLFSQDGLLLTGTERGIFSRVEDGWQLAVPGINKPHICPTPDEQGRWFYAAIDEVGWLRRDGQDLVAERHPLPGLGPVFIGVQRVDGDYWFELGSGRVARAHAPTKGPPQVRVYTVADGLQDTWVQLFVVDGELRSNTSGNVMRYDRATDRFKPDEAFVRSTHGAITEHGRPVRDASGRLWITTKTGVQVVAPPAMGVADTAPFPPSGIVPILVTMQPDGVVWMHQRQRLTRFDPVFPTAPAEPLRALIGTVQLAGTRRDFHFVSGALPALEYTDNSLTLSLLAPGANPNLGVTFEVQLQGRGEKWESVGAGGVASFSQLKEGDYVVQARARSAYAVGDSTSLAFTIRPPWYRTGAAYLTYVLGALGLVVTVAAGWNYLAQQKQRELAHLVDLRTADLRHSEERYRLLATELEERVQVRTAALESVNRDLGNANRELESFSYSVSHDLRAPLRGIDGWSLALLEDYGDRLDSTAHEYLQRVRNETQRLGRLIDDLLKLARTTRAEFRRQTVDLSALAADIARRLAEGRPDVTVEFHCQPGLVVQGDPRLLEAALGNLLDNAWKFSAKVSQPRVEFASQDSPEGPVFRVRDNGAGFDMRHAAKLFGVFQRMHTQGEFPGTGVGLATVQRAVHRHGGRVWAESSPGAGTTFYFTLPASAGIDPVVAPADVP